jgi:hypothetical protein
VSVCKSVPFSHIFKARSVWDVLNDLIFQQQQHFDTATTRTRTYTMLYCQMILIPTTIKILFPTIDNCKISKATRGQLVAELFMELWARWEPYWELVTIRHDGFTSPVWSSIPNSSTIHIATKVLFRLNNQSIGSTYY